MIDIRSSITVASLARQYGIDSKRITALLKRLGHRAPFVYRQGTEELEEAHRALREKVAKKASE